MWFAVNVREGCEAEALAALQERAAIDGLQELFVPQVLVEERRSGHWERVEVPMFPGRVIVRAPGEREVRTSLRRARGLQDVLVGRPSACELPSADCQLLDELTKPGERTVGLSEGRMERGRVVVEAGPLLGNEALICRVSHRKRRAYLSVGAGGESQRVQVGLNVTKAGVKPLL